MGRISKSLASILILIIIISILSLMVIKSAYAQGLSTPVFTVKLIDGSYTVPTTYSTDPYTGATITNGGNTIQTRNVTFTIQNIPQVNWYLLEYKGHYSSAWVPIFTWGLNTTFPASSGSTTTFTIINSNPTVASNPQTNSLDWENWVFSLAQGSKIDFRLQAVSGTESNDPLFGYSANHPIIVGNASPWSETQTLTILDNSVSISTSPTPSSTPTQGQTPTSTPTVPEFPTLIALLSVIGVTLTLIVLKKSRR